ncbi:Cytosolic Fe-S cluster assembly factor NUBP2-like protein [Smittium mucronatum]|uniref:Cytosolic Fe-S cluster assembly factor NUBP2-like protein n=1 Tax=Smittium mucronatum TaxID=133383 RepID=A0A1R0H8I3_9FUNG|nr:Cytosolic Fe-S cluster assembly factor NUBP2-like protein [Smittium mucronatum]
MNESQSTSGVGKSSVTVQVAMGLKQLGKRVGILDIDLCGPSIPRMLGLEEFKIHQSSSGWVPVYVDSEKRLGVMSLGFLLPDKNSSVVWRGPKKSTMIKQFLTDVHWGDIDYLIVDTPPGTSDEHLTVVENLQEYNPDGAILVTTPQMVSILDVQKELNFCKKVNLPILGVVENMSGGGGQQLASKYQVPFLGSIPIDPSLATLLDNTSSPTDSTASNITPDLSRASLFVSKYIKSPLSSNFSLIAAGLDSKLSVLS